MKILLTGGSGFIGRNILEQLEGRHEVISPSQEEADFTDYGASARFFETHKFDAVICAPAKRADERDAMDGLLAYATLTKCAAESGVKRLITLGSGGEYDSSRPLCEVGEEEFGKCIPRDEAAFPGYLENFITQPGLKVYNLRCFGVFGKHEDYASSFISNAICRALCGYSIALKQDKVVSCLYVEDLAQIAESFLTEDFKHRDYNVASHEKWSLLDIARLVRKICGKDIGIDLANETKGPEYTGCNGRLCSELSFAFTPMVDAVKMLHDWYLLNFDMIIRERLFYCV